MDYSASIHDSDHGASPWGSPDPTRTGFGSSGERPPSPYRRPFTAASNSDGGDDDGGFGSGDHEYRRPGTASSTASAAPTEESIGGQTIQPTGYEQSSNYQYPQQQPDQQPPDRAPLPLTSQSGEGASQPTRPQQPPQPQYRLHAKITALERTGRKDPILRFDVHTNLPRFRTTQYRDVRRLHSEFEKLAEHLISANPEALVPAVPPALTSAGAGTEEDEARVKALMQRWFNYVCSNEVLMHDEEMVLFVESNFGYSPLVKKKQPATGMRRKILKQFSPPADDTPELQQARPIVKLFYLGTMDAGHKVDKLVKARRGLGLAESDFGVKLGAMSVQEPHPGLANAYRKLGKVIQTAGDYQAAQATAEATTMGDPLQYHSSDALIFKETLTNRQLLTRELLQAQETTRSRLNAADRLRSSSNVRREKVDEAIDALGEARQHEAELAQKTARVTLNLVGERRKWFARTAADLRLSLREYVIREIEAERRTLALLESVRTDIRSIDGSGGLSRLGREAHPTVRRSSMASSQGPKGDAWSGLPRRSETLLGRGAGVAGSSGALSPAGVPSGSGSIVSGGDLGGDGPDEYDGALGQTRKSIPTIIPEEEDDDRIDARNAASRLATSTF